MTMCLWLDEKAERTLDLGPTFKVWDVFRELAAVAGTETGWDELLGVPGFGETQEELDPAYAEKAGAQAKAFLEKYDDELSEQAQWLLSQVATLATGDQ